jgi:hypothetical protein
MAGGQSSVDRYSASPRSEQSPTKVRLRNDPRAGTTCALPPGKRRSDVFPLRFERWDVVPPVESLMRIVTVLPLLPALAAFACGTAANEETAGQAAELSGAATTIVAEHSGKCLDVRGGPAAKNDGAAIEQWTCTGESNQAWTLTDKGNGQYQIAASSSGKCLDLAGGATANGTPIQQATCTGASRQLWKLRMAGNGRHEVVSVSSGRCLDITGGPSATGDGALAELWDCTGDSNQAWALTTPGAVPSGPTTTAPTPVAVHAKHSGKCLDVRGGPGAVNDGALIEQWSCTGEANQAWTFKVVNGTRYQIIAKSSGKCLDLAGGGGANGTGIQQRSCNNAPTQLWTLKSIAGGASEIVSVSSGRCLDVTGGISAVGDGVLTELWDCTGQANQAWQIGGVAPPPATPPGTPDPGAGGPNVGPFGQDASQYTLTFADEFEGNGLDQSKWVDHLWYLPADATPNYAVNNGSLKIWPVPGTNLHRNYRHITTDEKYYQTYGYFEMEAKLPRGRGPWPAFWLYNHDAPTLRPEIDIMEAYPGGGPNSGWSDAQLRPTAFAATIWLGPEGVNGGHKTLQAPDLSAGFHRYAVKWEPNRQTYYFDGQPFFTANVSMTNRMYILLSYQFGSASGEADGSTPTGPSNAFEVRYVRAWKMK